ncbi:hypothetical protein [Pseudomonas migulae]|uniref:hypothetical protein n=1 Tax=Pseudomonas migulae TaxID=78543 RepID=UPI001114F858|nr:hypothetical protein [Pseudomonas migulae]
MRIKDLVVVIVVYQLVVSLCIVQAAFFVWLTKKLVVLEGWVFFVVAGAIFVGLLIFNIRYVVPELKSDVLGLPSGAKKKPNAAIYFDIFAGSMLGSFFIMMFVDRFFFLESTLYSVVAILVFLILVVGFVIRVKSLRAR